MSEANKNNITHGYYKMQRLYQFLETRKPQLLRAYEITKEHVLFPEYSGRSSIHELSKTEKTMMGTVFEVVAKKELGIDEGVRLDCKLDDFEYDIKLTCRERSFNWMIPPECVGETCLLVHCGDKFIKVGVFEALESNLNRGQNRDKKRTISKLGKGCIRWVLESIC